MKHYSFLIITCLLLCNVALGEVVANLEGKCGYKDANGDLIIDYLYDFMSDFSDHDLAIVRNGLKFGMVDRQGNVVLPLSYTEIGPFNNGVAIVKKAQRPTQENQNGGFKEQEAKIDVSNVMLVCPSCDKATRVGHAKNDEGKKVRVCKKCGAQF